MYRNGRREVHYRGPVVKTTRYDLMSFGIYYYDWKIARSTMLLDRHHLHRLRAGADSRTGPARPGASLATPARRTARRCARAQPAGESAGSGAALAPAGRRPRAARSPAASAAASPTGAKLIPARPPAASRSAGRSLATTGSPVSAASSSTRPKPSPRLGTASASAAHSSGRDVVGALARQHPGAAGGQLGRGLGRRGDRHHGGPGQGRPARAASTSAPLRRGSRPKKRIAGSPSAKPSACAGGGALAGRGRPKAVRVDGVGHRDDPPARRADPDQVAATARETVTKRSTRAPSRRYLTRLRGLGRPGRLEPWPR